MLDGHRGFRSRHSAGIRRTCGRCNAILRPFPVGAVGLRLKQEIAQSDSSTTTAVLDKTSTSPALTRAGVSAFARQKATKPFEGTPWSPGWITFSAMLAAQLFAAGLLHSSSQQVTPRLCFGRASGPFASALCMPGFSATEEHQSEFRLAFKGAC